MKRFVDLRASDTGYRFAFWDTITDKFETHGGCMAWDTWSEFLDDYDGDAMGRYEALCPSWAFEEPQ